MSVKYNLSNAAAINASILKWAGRGKAVKEEGQTIVVGIIEHMIKHGDFTAVYNNETKTSILFDATKVAFGNALQLAMKEYILKYTWLSYNEENKSYYKDKDKVGKPGVMDLDAAKAEKWYDIERPARETPFDVHKAIDSLLAKAMKNQANIVDLRDYLDRKVAEQLAKMPVLEVAQQIDAVDVAKALKA